MHLATALFAMLGIVAGQGTLVLAGTTGAITGTVVDSATKAPIAGAKVTAASPSQVISTTTDATGHYGLLSLAPDTYTLSIEKTGFEPSSLSGVTVQSDQNLVQQLSTTPVLKTIGSVRSRSATSLVRAGVTSDVYNVTPAQQAAAAPLGGGNNLNAAYSAIASTPGTLVPISNAPGGQQSVFIRGGDYTQTGYEVDGIPVNRAFDQYAGSPLSNLGNAEVQIYTGGQPADAQANGLAGYVNQVIRTGTYPGFANAQVGVGGPGYYHKFSFETGGATPNRNFSYYLGFLGYNQENRYVDQFNGANLVGTYGSTTNYIARNCGTPNPSVGCYVNGPNANLVGNLPIGPNGYVTSGYFASLPSSADREATANIHIGVPHPRDGIKDDIQLFYNTGQTYNQPNASLQAFGNAQADVLNGTAFGGTIPNDANGLCAGGAVPTGTGPLACAPPVATNYIDQNFYGGPLNAPLTANNLTRRSKLVRPRRVRSTARSPPSRGMARRPGLRSRRFSTSIISARMRTLACTATRSIPTASTAVRSARRRISSAVRSPRIISFEPIRAASRCSSPTRSTRTIWCRSTPRIRTATRAAIATTSRPDRPSRPLRTS